MARSIALVLALALFGGGCASHTIEITESRAMAPKRVENVSVFVSLLRRGGDRGIFHGVKKALPGALASCGVEATIVPGMPEKRFGDGQAPPYAGGPDAQLIIRSRWGELRTVTTVGHYGNVLDDRGYKDMELEFWMELFEHKQNRVTWRAFAKLHMTDQGNVVGEELARMVVARLRADGVLRDGCR